MEYNNTTFLTKVLNKYIYLYIFKNELKLV